jgi:hypothetical protein
MWPLSTPATGGSTGKGVTVGSWWSGSDRLSLPRTHQLFGYDFQPISHRKGRGREELTEIPLLV